MSVSIGASDFQIVVDDPRQAQDLLPEFERWKTEAPAGPGFRLQSPPRKKGLRVALGADGAPIARSRQTEVVTSVLRRHLDALIGGSQTDCSTRLGLRAIVGPAGVLLVDASLLRSQPVIERRFAAHSLKVVDSPFVDVVLLPNSIALQPVPRSELSTDEDLVGHASDPANGSVVKGLLWMGQATGSAPSTAQVAHALASSARSGSREQRVQLGIDLAERMHVVLVDPTQRSSLVGAAAELLSSS